MPLICTSWVSRHRRRCAIWRMRRCVRGRRNWSACRKNSGSNLVSAVSLAGLKKELAAAADPLRARNLAWFFKTGEGQYGHGDRFIGLTVPVARRIARRYISLPLKDVEKLLASPIHEHRFAALEILVAQYERGDGQAVFDFYLKH